MYLLNENNVVIVLFVLYWLLENLRVKFILFFIDSFCFVLVLKKILFWIFKVILSILSSYFCFNKYGKSI